MIRTGLRNISYQVQTQFHRVPACDTDLERLHAVIDENVEPNNRINFDIIKRSIKKLKTTQG